MLEKLHSKKLEAFSKFYYKKSKLFLLNLYKTQWLQQHALLQVIIYITKNTLKNKWFPIEWIKPRANWFIRREYKDKIISLMSRAKATCFLHNKKRFLTPLVQYYRYFLHHYMKFLFTSCQASQGAVIN